MDELQREAGLEFGLVEAGERPPGVGRFELRRRVTLLAADGAVETAQRVPDAALPRDLAHRPRRTQCDPLPADRGPRVELELEPQLVAARKHVLRQSEIPLVPAHDAISLP